MTIICDNLVKIYSQTGVDILALQGLDLVIQDGEIIGIVGESGSGKSTLLNIIGGLDSPTAGKCIVDGDDISQLSQSQLDEYRSKKVGFLWQQPSRNLDFFLSVRENVLLPMQFINLDPKEKEERVRKLIDMVGLTERTNYLPAQLSGGEQQRTAIAVALANQPSIVLADEPTGELDLALSEEIYKVLNRLNKNNGTTIIVVSHDPNLAQYVDRVIAICDGKTSTETVKIENLESLAEDFKGGISQATEEYLMLDSAGRLQIPKSVLKQFGIGNRVKLRTESGFITLASVEGDAIANLSNEDFTTDLFNDDEPVKENKSLLRLFRKR